VFVGAVFSSCNYVDLDSNLPDLSLTRQAEDGELILKAGVISSSWQYVQKDVPTIITLVARDGYAITDIHWAIEDSVYNGLTIAHVFKTVRDVTIHATATLGDGNKLTADFTVSVVKDMSPYEPIKIFVIEGDYLPFNEGFQFEGQTRWKVLMLFSKERMKNTAFGYGYWGSFDDYNPSFDMETWGPVVPISSSANNFIIKDGLPSMLTGEVGKYFAAHLQLLPREYRMFAGDFLDKDKMLFAYGDFTGSQYIKTSSANFWMIRFRLNVDGSITPLGD
jgi:hypothetical protein